MGGTFTNWASLEAAIANELSSAVEEAVTNTYEDADMEMRGFYTQGIPLVYSRTGQLGGAARRTGISKSGKSAFGEVYLDTGLSWGTGTPGFPVVEMAEINGAGILGRGGFWQRTLNKAEMNLRIAMHKRFG